MNTITIKNISKSYFTKTLFEEVSFSVTKGDRVAIVGTNGAGKSTLLKIIAGKVTPDKGKIIQELTTIDYISQEFTGETSVSILEYLDTTQATPRVFDIIKKFGVVSEDQVENAFLETLSEGQKRVVEISAVLSRSPMFLCIDEPENHLDIKTRMILSEILQNYWGAVLFVSHDRYLINDIANKILSIQNHCGVLSAGKTYEQFLEEEALKTSGALARFRAEDTALIKLEDSVRMLKARTRYNDAQAKTYQMKKKQLKERRTALGRRSDIDPPKLDLETGFVKQKQGKLILGTKKVGFSYSESPRILKGVNVDMRFGDTVVLLGRNGTGKTSFLKLIMQELIPTEGEVRIGNNLRIEYVDQLNSLDSTMSPLEHFYDRGFGEEDARSILAKFHFTQSESEIALEILSGGQQQRFKFLLLFKVNPEFIILDEPTNNLDPATWKLLLDLVNEFTGSLLLVSHDRSFVEGVKDKRIWVLKNKTIKESWSELDKVLVGL
jgi:ATPase subunit of ABC transporter with duplicated ATPase domains